MSTRKIRIMAEVAFFASLAFLIDFMTQPLAIGAWISLSFKMLPIFLVSFRWGIKAGMTAGFIWGILQVITGQASAGFLNLIQGFLEYFIAFALIGLSGLFAKAIQDCIADHSKLKLTGFVLLGVVLGGLSRYTIHFLAGIIFWKDYIPAGQVVWLYSLMINGFSWLGESLACFIILFFLLNTIPRLINTD